MPVCDNRCSLVRSKVFLLLIGGLLHLYRVFADDSDRVRSVRSVDFLLELNFLTDRKTGIIRNIDQS
jgi:hypothetical protein